MSVLDLELFLIKVGVFNGLEVYLIYFWIMGSYSNSCWKGPLEIHLIQLFDQSEVNSKNWSCCLHPCPGNFYVHTVTEIWQPLWKPFHHWTWLLCRFFFFISNS